MRFWLGLIVLAAGLGKGLGAMELRLEGELVQGALIRGKAAQGSKIWFEGRPLRLGADGRFVFGIGRDVKGPVELRLWGPGGTEERRRLEVRSRIYQVQRINGLPPCQVDPKPEDLARIKADQKLLDQARALDTARLEFAETMSWPVLGPISGVFGSQRILNGQLHAPHRGVDIAAPEGTPIGAMAGGIVRVAVPDMYFTGGTVMIDHGHGVSSIYAHMAEVRVTVGQRLAQGDVVGLLGATGRVTGPHLHWGIHWFDEAVDPAYLVGPMPKS